MKIHNLDQLKKQPSFSVFRTEELATFTLYKSGDPSVAEMMGYENLSDLPDVWIEYVGDPKVYPLGKEAPGFLGFPLEMVYKEVQQSNLMDHARRELAMMGEEEWIVDHYLDTVRLIAGQGHSGFSMEVFWSVLSQLIRFNNLTPLTRNPDEWQETSYGSWQNKRNSSVFSRTPDFSDCYSVEGRMKRLWYAPWKKAWPRVKVAA